MLLRAEDPIGPESDKYLIEEAEKASQIVVAWGTNGHLLNRHSSVMNILRSKRVKAFGINKNGTPKHPLYVPKAASLIEFQPG